MEGDESNPFSAVNAVRAEKKVAGEPEIRDKP